MSERINYLKYYRVVMFWAKLKHEISKEDLEVLIFLYDEKDFRAETVKMAASTMSWDKWRMARLKNEGWIDGFRNIDNSRAKFRYNLSHKSKLMIANIYALLEGKEFPEAKSQKIYRKNVPYSHKVYRSMILRLNKEIRIKQEEIARKKSEEDIQPHSI